MERGGEWAPVARSLSKPVTQREREKKMTAATPCSIQGTSSNLLVNENGYAHAKVGNATSVKSCA